MKIYLVEDIDLAAYNRLKEYATFTKDIKEADIILTRNLTITKAVIDSARSLRAIAIHGTGVSDCDVEYAKSKGITVFNAPYQNYESVAEMALMLALMASRRADNKTYFTSLPRGIEMYGKKASILGYGHIGKRLHELLNAFHMDIKIYQRESSEETLKDCLQSDYVFLTMSLNEDNYHFINENRLSFMNHDTILVNVARGGLVNIEDVSLALRNNKLGYYASDVFENEPISMDAPFLHERMIAFPHIGSNTKDALYNIGTLLTDQIICFIEGSEIAFKL